MEKVSFLPNGQWILNKSKSKGITFKHQFSEPEGNSNEDFYNHMVEQIKNPTSHIPKGSYSLQEHMKQIPPTELPDNISSRVHWLSVHHPEFGNLGLFPISTIKVNDEDPVFYTAGYPMTKMPHNDNNMKFTGSISGIGSDAWGHANLFQSALKGTGLNHDDIIDAFDEFTSNLDNTKADELADEKSIYTPREMRSRAKFANYLHNAPDKSIPSKYQYPKTVQTLENKRKNIELTDTPKPKGTPLQ